jgi:bifunctional enzyme CysN/CysC
MTEAAPLRLVIAGHPDHGKSTLIGRLLVETGSIDAERLAEIRRRSAEVGLEDQWAFLVDQFESERVEGLTIDTAQVFFRSRGRAFVLIDVPGQAEFLRNMITGATRAEAALLIVAADEGVAEQTRRHALLLALLGIESVVVACNKMDAAGFSQQRFAEVDRDMRACLAALSIEPLCAIPISASRGDNVLAPSDAMPWYSGPTLIEAIERIAVPAPADFPARFVVQDSYDVDGRPCAAGRLLSGRIGEGERVVVYPEAVPARVGEIVRFPVRRDPAEVGECVALALESETGDAARPERGSIVVAAERSAAPHVSRAVTGRVFWWGADPLRLGEELVLRCSVQETAASVTAILRTIRSSTLEVDDRQAERLDAPDVGDVVLAADREIVTEPFHRLPALGRFVLERNATAVGAGIVLTEPPPL